MYKCNKSPLVGEHVFPRTGFVELVPRKIRYHGISRFSTVVCIAVYQKLYIETVLVQHIKCVRVGQFICFSSITTINLKKIDLTLPIRT